MADIFDDEEELICEACGRPLSPDEVEEDGDLCAACAQRLKANSSRESRVSPPKGIEGRERDRRRHKPSHHQHAESESDF